MQCPFASPKALPFSPCRCSQWCRFRPQLVPVHTLEFLHPSRTRIPHASTPTATQKTRSPKPQRHTRDFQLTPEPPLTSLPSRSSKVMIRLPKTTSLHPEPIPGSGKNPSPRAPDHLHPLHLHPARPTFRLPLHPSRPSTSPSPFSGRPFRSSPPILRPSASHLQCSVSISQHSASILRYSANISQHFGSILRYSASISQHPGSILRYSVSILPHSASISRPSVSIFLHSASIFRCSVSIFLHMGQGRRRAKIAPLRSHPAFASATPPRPAGNRCQTPSRRSFRIAHHMPTRKTGSPSRTHSRPSEQTSNPTS